MNCIRAYKLQLFDRNKNIQLILLSFQTGQRIVPESKLTCKFICIIALEISHLLYFLIKTAEEYSTNHRFYFIFPQTNQTTGFGVLFGVHYQVGVAHTCQKKSRSSSLLRTWTLFSLIFIPGYFSPWPATARGYFCSVLLYFLPAVANSAVYNVYYYTDWRFRSEWFKRERHWLIKNT